jgi:hypothetical protein
LKLVRDSPNKLKGASVVASVVPVVRAFFMV